MNLRIPGPTPIPNAVARALGTQMINHRGPEFRGLLERITARLKTCFQTESDVVLLTASGTGAMEAAIVNTMSPGERVLALSCGAFGERFAAIAARYGARVRRLEAEWGRAIDPDVLEKALRKNPAVSAVLITHNETSTGITNDLQELARVCRKYEKLVLVDAVSSLACVPVRTDEWGIDVIFTASQKGWMAPPGIAMLAISERAWNAYHGARMPRFYFDLGEAKRYGERGQTPWTPALSVMYALDAALDLILQEGLAHVWARHRALAELARTGILEAGFELFAAADVVSDTVTAVKIPQNMDWPTLAGLLRNEYGVIVAGGQGKLAGSIFRVAHMGYVSEPEIRGTVNALADIMQRSNARGSE